jgi:hypothetical protein
MSSIGQRTAREINELLNRSGRLWQDGFYDHRCREDEDLNEPLQYIEYNPVRAGLVDRPELWPYSSANPGLGHLLDREWFRQLT